MRFRAIDLAGGCPTFSLLLEDQRFEEGFGNPLAFLVEAGDGLEQKAQFVIRPALVLVEQQ